MVSVALNYTYILLAVLSLKNILGGEHVAYWHAG